MSNGENQQGGDAHVNEAIQAFEQILELFPEDIGALESLAAAYEQGNDFERALEMNCRLVKLHQDSAQWDKVAPLAEKILAQDPANAEVKGYLDKANKKLNDYKAEIAEKAAGIKTYGDLSVDMNGEYELGAFLLQSGVVTQEQYQASLDNLKKNLGSSSQSATLCLLAELQAIDGLDIERIIDFLCKETDTPFIEVLRCEIDEGLADGIIPLKKCKRLGVLPLGVIGTEIMLAYLNPLPTGLRINVESYLQDYKLHFFLTAPVDLETALQRLIDKREKAALESKQANEEAKNQEDTSQN